MTRDHTTEMSKSRSCQSTMNMIPGILLIIIGTLNIWSISKSLKEIKKLNPEVCNGETYCKIYDGIIMINILLIFGVVLDSIIGKSSKLCTICSGIFWLITYGITLIVNSATMINGSDGIMVGTLLIEAEAILKMFSLKQKMLFCVALIMNMIQWTLVLIITSINAVDFLLDWKKRKMFRRQVLPTTHEDTSTMNRYPRTIRDLHEQLRRQHNVVPGANDNLPSSNGRQVIHASSPPKYNDLFCSQPRS